MKSYKLHVTSYNMKLDAKQLRELEEEKVKGPLKVVTRNPIYFILENIYDTYNVGGLFRLADAIAVEKIYLCGEMEIPPNSRIKKASIGTYKVVPWEYKKNTNEAIDSLFHGSTELKNNGAMRQWSNETMIIAVEQHAKAVAYTQVDYSFPLALIFGNESYGILPDTLELADQIVEIPMWGINKSLNVIVSAAIVSYFAINSLSNSNIEK